MTAHATPGYSLDDLLSDLDATIRSIQAQSQQVNALARNILSLTLDERCQPNDDTARARALDLALASVVGRLFYLNRIAQDGHARIDINDEVGRILRETHERHQQIKERWS